MSKAELDRIKDLEDIIEGDGLNNGLKGISKDHDKRIRSIESVFNTIKGLVVKAVYTLVIAAIFASITYSVNTVRDGNNANHQRNHSHDMDNNSKLFQRGQSDNNTNNRQYKDGN